MNILFFDDRSWENLLPLTYTKPVSEIRVGIHKISEKWKRYFPDSSFSHITKKYLAKKYSHSVDNVNLLISGALLPNTDIVSAITGLKVNEALYSDSRLLAYTTENPDPGNFDPEKLPPGVKKTEFSGRAVLINYSWEIFRLTGNEISADLGLISKDRKSYVLSKSNNILGNNLFAEEGVKAEFATINTTTGPVYLGKNAELMEGCMIRGPFALGEDSVVKMSAKIYGPTTIGPSSKVGGEVNNVVIQGFSNKAHDGFLGNSVVGEWCNLGADTNNSNLKNNYADVRLWSYPEERFISTGLQFCGLIMGDHSKCGINTMFNTGTVVGVNANIFGAGFPRNFIPSFSWGGAHGFTTYSLNKALEVASLVVERRNMKFDKTEQEILNEVFRLTEKYRR